MEAIGGGQGKRIQIAEHARDERKATIPCDERREKEKGLVRTEEVKRRISKGRNVHRLACRQWHSKSSSYRGGLKKREGNKLFQGSMSRGERDGLEEFEPDGAALSIRGNLGAMQRIAIKFSPRGVGGLEELKTRKGSRTENRLPELSRWRRVKREGGITAFYLISDVEENVQKREANRGKGQKSKHQQPALLASTGKKKKKERETKAYLKKINPKKIQGG